MPADSHPVVLSLAIAAAVANLFIWPRKPVRKLKNDADEQRRENDDNQDKVEAAA